MNGFVSVNQRNFLLFCVSLALSAGSVDAAQRRALQGHVPAAVKQAQLVGRLPGDQQLHLCLGVQLRNQTELDALLRDLYDPASPRYRHFLTPDQFTAAFAPTEQDYAAVAASARAHGLTVAPSPRDHRLVDVTGAAADVERMFHVTLREYRHPTQARNFFAPDTEPTVDANLRVADVWGISDYPQPRPLHSEPIPLDVTAAPNGTGSYGGYFIGSDFRNAYAPGVTNLTGVGQTVALFQVDGFSLSDITNYEAKAGISAVPLQTVLFDGFNGSPTSSPSGRLLGWQEVSLDIEATIAMAPGLTKVIVYEGNPSAFYPSHVLSRIAADNLARQISCSWAWTGGPDATFGSYLQQMAAQGQSFFQASGDSGAYPSGYLDDEANSTEPVDSPYVTCTGGITLTTGSGQSWLSDTVWSGGGGGVSSYYSIPSWQQGVSMASNQGSTVNRNIPDVALVAANVYTYCNGSGWSMSGTSCAAPLWAGFCALVNQQAALNALQPVGFLNPALYAIGTGTSYTACFHDTTTGNNTNASSPSSFYAVPGYDLCTGWGTPRGSNLINKLAPFNSLRITPLTPPAFIGPVGGAFALATNSLLLVNPGAAAVTWSAGTTSTWFTLVPSSGTLAAGGSTNVLVSLKAAATSLVANVYSGTAWFTNSLDGTVQNRSFSLLTGQSVVQNGGFETGDLTSWVNYGYLEGNVVVANGSYYRGDPASIRIHSGANSLSLCAVGSLGYISQTLQTVSNRPYLLSFWLQNHYSGITNEFLVQWGGNTLLDQTNMPAFGWSNVQFVVMANASTVALTFGARNDLEDFSLDDISAQLLTMPMLGSIAASTNVSALAWSASTNVHYQPQFTTNLVAANWVNLGAPILGTGATMTVTDSSPVSSQRFYRVLLQP